MSPSRALTATLVVTRILDMSWPLLDHSEMYRSHSLALLVSNRLANLKRMGKLIVDHQIKRDYESGTHKQGTSLLLSNGKAIKILSVVHDEMILPIGVHDQYNIILTSSIGQQPQHGNSAFTGQLFIMQHTTCNQQKLDFMTLDEDNHQIQTHENVETF